MKIDIITLFLNMFDGPFSESIIKHAKEKNKIKINLHDLRKFGLDNRRTVDGRPYGGGPGMLLRVDIVDKAIKSIKRKKNSKIILLDAGGEKFNQKIATKFSKLDQLILICGHYEGIDHRVHENLVDEIISIGDYVLTGGEIPAMVITDTVTRLIPGVIKPESLEEESHSHTSGSEYPQYTRPENYRDWKVPEILLSGHHEEITKWRKSNS